MNTVGSLSVSSILNGTSASSPTSTRTLPGGEVGAERPGQPVAVGGPDVVRAPSAVSPTDVSRQEVLGLNGGADARPPSSTGSIASVLSGLSDDSPPLSSVSGGSRGPTQSTVASPTGTVESVDLLRSGPHLKGADTSKSESGLTVAELERVVGEVAGSVGRHVTGRCVMLLGNFARRLFPAGVFRPSASVDDIGVQTRRGREQFGSVVGWSRLPSWGALLEAVKVRGPGSAGFVLLGRPGEEGHAFAVSHTRDGGLQWVELRVGAGARLASVEMGEGIPGELELSAAMGSAVSVRALVVDAEGAAVLNALEPAVESASVARAMVDWEGTNPMVEQLTWNEQTGQWLADGAEVVVQPLPGGRPGVTMLPMQDYLRLPKVALLPGAKGWLALMHATGRFARVPVRRGDGSTSEVMLSGAQVAQILARAGLGADELLLLASCRVGEAVQDVLGRVSAGLAQTVMAGRGRGQVLASVDDVVARADWVPQGEGGPAHGAQAVPTLRGELVTVGDSSWRLFEDGSDVEGWDVVNDRIRHDGPVEIVKNGRQLSGHHLAFDGVRAINKG
jgi:hypothetical protein